MEGVSASVVRLIFFSRRKISAANQKLSWSQRVSCCGQAKFDLFQTTISNIINLLTKTFERSLQHRTINLYRSAKSAYHEIPVGQYSKVCALLVGVFKKRSLQPRYTFVWDVEVVLRFIRENGLRVSIMKHLNATFVVKKSNKITFNFNKLHKSWKRGQPPPSICYYSFPEEPELCVVMVFEEYSKVSQPPRYEEHSQLLLSTIKPETPVFSSAISGQLTQTLQKAGINAEIFKGHSVRSVFSCKVLVSESFLTEVLKKAICSDKSTLQKFFNTDIVK